MKYKYIQEYSDLNKIIIYYLYLKQDKKIYIKYIYINI